MTELRRKMTEDPQLRGLAERTLEAYLRAVRKLAKHFRAAPDRLDEGQVREYIPSLKNERDFGEVRGQTWFVVQKCSAWRA